MRLKVLLIPALAALPSWSQPCDMPPTLKTALDAVPASSLKLFRDEHKDSYFAHRAYQDSQMDRGVFKDYVQGEYRAFSGLHPDDPMFQTLFARALTGTRTPEAIEILNGVIAKHPTYPYARMKLVEIYASPAFKDDQKLRENLEAYQKACPESLTGYNYASRIDDPDFQKRSAATLRKLLDGRADTAAAGSYNTLWTLEFKTVPLAGQDAVRERIRKDAAKLRAEADLKNGMVMNTLGQAYKMLGDADGSKWVDEHKPAESHAGGLSVASETIMKWRMANQSSGGNFQEIQEKLAKQADEWIRQWPDDPAPYEAKFQALRIVRDAPLEDVVKTGQQWISVYEKHPTNNGMSPYLQVAQFYSMHNMRYDELPGMVDKALAENRESNTASRSDLYPPSGMMRLQPYLTKWSNWNSAAGIYIKIKQYDKARDLLAKLGPSLKEMKPPESGADMEKRQFSMHERQYWDNMTRLAEAEHHKLDALIFNRRSDLTPAMFQQPEAYLRSREQTARATWKELGGTDEGFDAWLDLPGGASPKQPPASTPGAQAAVASVAQPWATLNKPLPEFHLTDAKGKTWTLADLKGRVTLVNLWATWCGPCRNELPWLEKVYSKLKDRTDITVVTFNVDDNLGLILPFVVENKYTFPVLPATDYIHKLIPELSIPRNWIVDADGIMRSEAIGFGAGGEKWIDETIAALERARATK